jgi:hypothetical protein
MESVANHAICVTAISLSLWSNSGTRASAEARGAVTGQNVNYVLLISTVAVIVLFVVA